MAIAEKVQQDVVLAPLTTIQLGGAARYFLPVHSEAELREALQWAKSEHVRVHILGGGSNTIFADAGFDGLIVQIAIAGIAFQQEGRHVLARVAAGEKWDPFVEECVRRELAGVECLSGIPGLVGATPIQNVGAYGQEVAQTIREVKTIEMASRQEKTFTNAECGFGYRASRFKGEDMGKYVVTEVVFRLEQQGAPTLTYSQVREAVAPSRASLREVRKAVLHLRKKKSMVLDPEDPNTHSCGSFFENLQLSQAGLEQLRERALRLKISEAVPTFEEAGIVRVPTAWLIEKAGFPKGFRAQGVGISDNHTLALVNFGGTSAQLLALADEIVRQVREKFGIALRREPVVVE